MLQRLAPSTRNAVFVYLTAITVVMASERMYWYWAGYTADSVLLLGAFYLIPTMIALWTLGWFRSRRAHGLVLGGAVFAFAVEGILTPVIYEDGVLPIMAALFVGWHGLLAFAGVWYLAHRWMVERRSATLTAAAAATGVFWGVWAYAASTLDPPTGVALVEAAVKAPLAPAGFAAYALGIGGTLVATHWLLGFVWPQDFIPSKGSSLALAIVSSGYFVLAVLLVVPWAPFKLAALLGGAIWLLQKGRSNNIARGSRSLIALAHGRVRLIDAALIMAMPAAAAAVYAVLWAAPIGSGLTEVIFATLNVVQVVAGFAAFWWASRKATAGSRSEHVPAPTLSDL